MTKRLPVIHGAHFWALMDALREDDSVFMIDRNSIADGFLHGNLYALYAPEYHPVLCGGSARMFPAFVLVDTRDNTPILLWVHTRAWRMGVGRQLMQGLSLPSRDWQLPESYPFWDALERKKVE